MLIWLLVVLCRIGSRLIGCTFLWLPVVPHLRLIPVRLDRLAVRLIGRLVGCVATPTVVPDTLLDVPGYGAGSPLITVTVHITVVTLL